MPEPQPAGDEPATSWVALAHILRPQGRKGEVLADLYTDFPERFETHPRVFLAPVSFAGSEEQARAFEVISFWLPVGKNLGRIVVHLSGIDSINAAESLSGLDVVVPVAERAALDDETNYVSDLVGCSLFDLANPESPVEVGMVTEVQFATSSDGSRRLDEAAPLLAVKTLAGDEVLVPFAKSFLHAIDTVAKRIEMSLPAGILEINR